VSKRTKNYTQHNAKFRGTNQLQTIAVWKWYLADDKSNIGTKCNSLTQQFIGISTTIDKWATCFDSYRVIFRPSKNTDPISKVLTV